MVLCKSMSVVNSRPGALVEYSLSKNFTASAQHATPADLPKAITN